MGLIDILEDLIFNEVGSKIGSDCWRALETPKVDNWN